MDGQLTTEGMRQYLFNCTAFINSHLVGELFSIKEPAMTAGMYGQAQLLLPPPLIPKQTPQKYSRPQPLMEMNIREKGRTSTLSEASSHSSCDKVVKICINKNSKLSTNKWVRESLIELKVDPEKYGY